MGRNRGDQRTHSCRLGSFPNPSGHLVRPALPEPPGVAARALAVASRCLGKQSWREVVLG